MTPPLISVVCATRNRPDSVRRLLASLRSQTIADRIEFVVVDDASTEPMSFGPEVRIIRNPTNLGPCGARNQGFRAATAPFMLLCDDDIEMSSPDLLERAVTLAEQHPTFAAIGFKHLDDEGMPHLNQPVATNVRVSTTVFYGYCVLFRREAILAVGGFNESIRYCYEEQELGFRLHDAGWEIMFDPSLTITHHHDPRGRDWVRIHRLITLNAIRTILMRFPLLWVVPGAMVKLTSFPLETIRRGRLDWRGTLWLWGQTFGWLLPSLRSRDPIRTATLRKYMHLRRRPVPVM